MIIRLFELCTGLSVNFTKSILYGCNVSANDLGAAAGTLGCAAEFGTISYLGMQIGKNHRTRDHWTGLCDKMKKKLVRWDGKTISMAGRAILIQSVLSAIPIYSLSFYIIPKISTLDLVRIQRAFLWGGDGENTKIPWVSWTALCKDTREGGLGFKDVGLFNKALIGK
ncbi:hypothetical protein ACS0TY_031669 [Phlomoides rotata]